MTDSLIRAARDAVQREDWVRAWHLLNAELNERPERPEALYLMGHVLRQQGNVGLALPLFAKALSLEQRVPNIWMNYGACLHDLNRWEDAIKAFTVVHAQLPQDDMPPANIAGSIVNMGKWHDAINWADKALAINPKNYIARIAKAFGCLGIGRWKDAWEHAEYLYGNHLDVRVYNPPEKEEPEWDGSKGKTVVVQCDQGIGDQLMFSQLIPRMQKDCKLVIMETVDRMVPLFRRNFPGVHVYGTLKKQGIEWPKDYQIDAHIHISYLGKFYLHKDVDFERKAYITAEPNLKAKWLRWLEQFPKPWIGLAWKGGIQQTQKHLRSVRIEDYAPVLKLPGTFIDLSYHDSSAEVAAWNIDNKTQIVRPPVNVADFEDTVALVAALDEVVTVTTTVAHVCGALGRTAHVMVPKVAQWRYAYKYKGGEKLIWYPEGSVRLYRQNNGDNDWGHVVRRIVDALRR
jgi:tetratricopeptide (TPR) repeat protein